MGRSVVEIKRLRCFDCDSEYLPEEIGSLKVMRCMKCNSVLDVEYDYEPIKRLAFSDSFRRQKPEHWKYRQFLPISDTSPRISMGEGGTALLTQKSLTKSLGASRLHIKYEAQNPTGSFKDRGTAVEITKALESNKNKVVVASTGNMGASIAAYCAFMDMRCMVFLPDITADEKIKQIRAHHVDVHLVDGDYSLAMKAAEEYVQNNEDTFLAGDYPWRCEGTKTLGLEIIDQLYWTPPDCVIVPIGNGTLLWGIYKAFKELLLAGFIEHVPNIIGVQANRCNPVTHAWKTGSKYIEPISNPKTIATAIACGDPIYGIAALRGIRESDGMAINVSEEEILAARNELARHGIFVEPSGAVAYAGALRIKDILKEKEVVCLATGHGLKDMYGL